MVPNSVTPTLRCPGFLSCRCCSSTARPVPAGRPGPRGPRPGLRMPPGCGPARLSGPRPPPGAPPDGGRLLRCGAHSRATSSSAAMAIAATHARQQPSTSGRLAIRVVAAVGQLDNDLTKESRSHRFSISMMAMENVVLVGVDGSPESRGASRWALLEAGSRHWPIWFVHVFSNPTIADPSVDSAYLRTAHRDAERLFQGLETEAGHLGISSQGLAVPGRANEVLVKLSNDAALTVVGRRHHTGIGARLSSVSSALAAHSHCPTAVIPLTGRRGCPAKFRRTGMLHPRDASSWRSNQARGP